MTRQKISTTLIATLFTIGAHAQSPYLHKVYEYRPAPGQFVNKLPEYEVGDNQEVMNSKAEASIAGENRVIITLGGYGGYLIFGFDHPVVNVAGEADLKIWGNAFASPKDPNDENSVWAGSSEPGVVMVSIDANGNGEPDDAWYELAGSEYHKAETLKHYRLTYHKPDENKVKVPMPGYNFINDMTYIKWESNHDQEGYLYRNTFHSQPYYPQWIEEESLSFEGTKLADNYVDESGNGSYYVQYAYSWGYADNYPNSHDRANLNIEWAVDQAGNSVHLPVIHFVKVYTGVNQYCGWLGESSTEIAGAEDLHPEAVVTNIIEVAQEQPITLLSPKVKEQLVVATKDPQTAVLYNQMGQKIGSHHLTEGTNYIPCHQLPHGIYLLVAGKQTVKFIKQ